MVKRVQVSLIITEEKTQSLVDSLRREKLLKNTIVRFLDKYAENPEQVLMWLNSDEDIQNGVVEENEKLTRLKESLALFSTFVETAKMQNDSNVDNFTDYLTDSQYIKFRTEFKKSEQIISNSELSYDEETIEPEESPKDLEKVVHNLTEQVQEMKTLLNKVITGEVKEGIKTETPVTTPEVEQVSVQEETADIFSGFMEQQEEVAPKTEPVAVEEPVEVEKEVAVANEVIESSAEEEEEDIDMSEALSIMDSLGQF